LTDTGAIQMGNVKLYVSDTPASSTTILNGAITGAQGSVFKAGPGTLIYNGAGANTYGGTTTVAGGSLNLQKGSLAAALTGPLVIGLGTGAPDSAIVNDVYGNQLGLNVNVTLNSDGELNFGPNSDSIGSLIDNGGAVAGVGSAFTLGGNLTATVNATIANYINLNAGNHTIMVASGATLNLSGQIMGAGNLTINGPGTTVMSGTVENYYTGTTTVNSGTLILDKANVGTDENNADVFSYGPLVIGDGTDVATVIEDVQDQIKDNQSVTINANAILNLNGFEDAIGALILNGGTVTSGAAGLLTLNGNITATGATSLIAGNLYLKDTNRIVDVLNATDVLTIAANITSIDNAHLIQTGLGTLNYNFVVNSGPMTVPVGVSFGNATVSSPGVLNVVGTLSGTATVSAGGTLNLQGGTVTGAVSIASSGILAGTGATGPLTLASGATFTTNVSASGSSQVSVTGAANLNGATLNIVLSTLPAANQTFTILSSTSAITGTFAGLANNATFTADGHTFKITYNLMNVVLTFLS
jgi:fibronectin-binding autotransporter adhesin